jgi:hypothetical protein
VRIRRAERGEDTIRNFQHAKQRRLDRVHGLQGGRNRRRRRFQVVIASRKLMMCSHPGASPVARDPLQTICCGFIVDQCPRAPSTLKPSATETSTSFAGAPASTSAVPRCAAGSAQRRTSHPQPDRDRQAPPGGRVARRMRQARGAEWNINREQLDSCRPRLKEKTCRTPLHPRRI